MATTLQNYWRDVAIAIVGLAFVGTGLSLAILSHPKRFSLSIADDQYIQLFAISGFACTLAGVLLFLYAVRNTTKSMPAPLRTKTNIGVGLGFVLQLAGLVLPEISRVPFETGLALVLAGIPALVWGGMNYAQGKGYPKSRGAWAIFSLLGLIALIVLPQRPSKPLANVGT